MVNLQSAINPRIEYQNAQASIQDKIDETKMKDLAMVTFANMIKMVICYTKL